MVVAVMVGEREGEAGVEEGDGEEQEDGGEGGAGVGAVAGTAARSLAGVSCQHSVSHVCFAGGGGDSGIGIAMEDWETHLEEDFRSILVRYITCDGRNCSSHFHS